MKSYRSLFIFGGLFLFTAILLASCGQQPTLPPSPPSPQAPAEQPTSPPPTQVVTEEPTEVAEAPTPESAAGAVHAVDLVGAWVEVGAPEGEAFEYTGVDGNLYQATFAEDVLPLFTNNGVWFEGAQACSGCHFASSENSYHELDTSTYQGILAGADVLEEPPGVSILGESLSGAGDFNWSASKLRERLRNNRMPPGFPFDITEENRNGPCVTASPDGAAIQMSADGKIEYGCDLNAVGLIGAWVQAGATKDQDFSYGEAQWNFERDVLPFFTQPDMWFEGSQACSGCHFAISENSYHELDTSTYEGILAGADSLEEPPGVSILGESEPGAGDFDWGASKLRARLRNNRMSPGFPFDITEENRNGPLVLHSQVLEEAAPTAAMFGSGECEVTAVNLFGAWVAAGAPESSAFDFTSADEAACQATFAEDILPLFTNNGVWFEGAQACSGCHFANSENSYHELDMSTHQGILAGADVLEEPPGVSILGESQSGAGDFDWSASKLRERLRNNRMPPGFPFDITEENRNGPCVTASPDGAAIQMSADGKIEYGCDLNAVGLIEAWVEAGAPKDQDFSYGEAQLNFERDVLPFFTQPDMWFEGSQACSGCHFAISENSYHELDLSSYEGILAGADSLEEPPGVSILGESEPGAGNFDWSASKLRARLRNNRMSPGFPFDITEENRNGPLVLAGKKK